METQGLSSEYQLIVIQISDSMGVVNDTVSDTLANTMKAADNENINLAMKTQLGVSMVTEKVITLLAMTVITFLFGMMPLKLFSQLRHNPDVSSRIRWRMLISFSSCFAGGVFIAACLLDLLPDVEEKISQVGLRRFVCSVFIC